MGGGAPSSESGRARGSWPRGGASFPGLHVGPEQGAWAGGRNLHQSPRSPPAASSMSTGQPPPGDPLQLPGRGPVWGPGTWLEAGSRMWGGQCLRLPTPKGCRGASGKQRTSSHPCVVSCPLRGGPAAVAAAAAAAAAAPPHPKGLRRGF